MACRYIKANLCHIRDLKIMFQTVLFTRGITALLFNGQIVYRV